MLLLLPLLPIGGCREPLSEEVVADVVFCLPPAVLLHGVSPKVFFGPSPAEERQEENGDDVLPLSEVEGDRGRVTFAAAAAAGGGGGGRGGRENVVVVGDVAAESAEEDDDDDDDVEFPDVGDGEGEEDATVGGVYVSTTNAASMGGHYCRATDDETGLKGRREAAAAAAATSSSTTTTTTQKEGGGREEEFGKAGGGFASASAQLSAVDRATSTVRTMTAADSPPAEGELPAPGGAAKSIIPFAQQQLWQQQPSSSSSKAEMQGGCHGNGETPTPRSDTACGGRAFSNGLNDKGRSRCSSDVFSGGGGKQWMTTVGKREGADSVAERDNSSSCGSTTSDLSYCSLSPAHHHGASSSALLFLSSPPSRRSNNDISLWCPSVLHFDAQTFGLHHPEETPQIVPLPFTAQQPHRLRKLWERRRKLFEIGWRRRKRKWERRRERWMGRLGGLLVDADLWSGESGVGGSRRSGGSSLVADLGAYWREARRGGTTAGGTCVKRSDCSEEDGGGSVASDDDGAEEMNSEEKADRAGRRRGSSFSSCCCWCDHHDDDVEVGKLFVGAAET